MELHASPATRREAVAPFVRAASLFVVVALLAACGGGDGVDRTCSPAPGFRSTPPPEATVGEAYRYLVDAYHECGEWIPLVCDDFSVIAAPSGTASDGRNVVAWTPPHSLAGATVQFTLRTVDDACGGSAQQSWTVRVRPDTTPPRVVRAWPVSGDLPVSVLPEIGADFSEVIDPATLTAASVVVSGPAGVVAGALRPTSEGFAFTPAAPLPWRTPFTVTVATAVADPSGNRMAAPYAWTFTTGVPPDTAAPSVPPAPTPQRVSGATVGFAWPPSTDDRRVAGYRLYRDGIARISVTDASATDSGLAFEERHCWTVSAFDDAGNESAPSAPSCLATLSFAPGAVARWGLIPTEDRRPSPDVEPGLAEVTALSPQAAALALRADGTVWALGAVPAQVAGVGGAIGVAGGVPAGFALLADGGVLGWGENRYGQLGDGTTTTPAAPVRMSAVGGAVAIASGLGHTLVLQADGTVSATGGNWFGQLGDGSVASTTVPVGVTSLPDVVAISAAWNTSLALARDGSVWTWGEYVFGSAGGRYVATPVQVPGLDEVVAISRGQGFSLAVRADGTVWGWGFNRSGQLGDGTTVERATPVRVVGLSDVIAVSAGADHALALRRDGTVWAWGANDAGQLGDGWTIGRSVPALVPGVAGARAISAFEQRSAALR